MEKLTTQMILQLARISTRNVSVLQKLIPLIPDEEMQSKATSELTESVQAIEKFLALAEEVWGNE